MLYYIKIFSFLIKTGEIMEKGDKFEAIIEKNVFGGDGMCKAPDGMVIFVENSLESEKLIVEVTSIKRSFGRGKIVKILEPSPYRAENPCKYAKDCCNCKYLFTSFEYENQLKQKQLRDIVMQAFPEYENCIQPIVFGKNELHYRNKAVFHAHRVSKFLDLGYIKSDNVSVVDIPECLLLCDEIQEEYKKLRENQSIMHSLRDGMELTLRYESEKNKVHYWRNSPDLKASWLKEELICGSFSVPVGSFFQVNREVANLLIEKVTQLINDKGFETCYDLYCGSGFFAFAVASLCKKVTNIIGTEIDERAIECAKFNLKNFENIISKFIAGDAAKKLPEILGNVPENSIVIVDPPRTGLDAKAVQAINRSLNIKDLIYISCNPSSWVRDMIRLQKHGFKLKEVQAFNMFNKTGHFELFSYISR